ncbi:MarR family winged helix-turn-helix transcriptional regulator [Agrobacterium radiobacter]|uniref:DNA-binding MarR family transcriptional regulator n=3 Tax=Agrobacterium tumefaciens complex TaxID=1183400 RepID=A0AAW8LSW1_AGRTU|nr:MULTISPECIES: MarR family transcriptional regulator [Agrobacterium tumefaciens complex]MCP2135466.1 DNA-binding MarR family transcriptional regulator [Rhizobium sp. SLBN-94]TGE82169.1 MarR family transcriptional regulator [Rhizobium sp. SEMIA 439]AYM04713.1 MarR family transcriptional regulator [Agrobacterium tumefaciens]EHH03319.1 MarR family transcriptional regulator [Agrobacterium tumefaciens CCNWGS0286]EPR07931.1 MarR family transcriptional regulator [Agrobacterium radiobacter DSM 30147
MATEENWNEDLPEDIKRIGNTMTRMRIMIGRRIIGRMALAKLAPGLELSHIDVLDILRRAEGDVTVGAIAEGMRIDPSRGSRVVADMVGRGLLKRGVSQEDGRRSIVEITPLGTSLLQEMRRTKMSVIEDVMDGWPAEDVETFARLFERFIDRFECRLSPDTDLLTDQKKS